MREWQFGKASSIAMGDALSYSKKRNGAEGFDWLFDGETIGIIDGVPRSAGMRKLELTDDYPYPDAEIGTKEELFNSLLKGECILTPCVESKYKALYVGKKKRKTLLEEYFRTLPEGTYVLLSEEWD